MSDIGPDSFEPQDEQLVAEAFDEENVEPDIDLDDWGPDHGMAAREAAVVTDTGDVPPDSLDERLWREEPDGPESSTDGWDEELIEPHPDFGLDQDFADESTAGFEHERSSGIAVGEVAGPLDEMLPAEEAAIHVIESEDNE